MNGSDKSLTGGRVEGGTDAVTDADNHDSDHNPIDTQVDGPDSTATKRPYTLSEKALEQRRNASLRTGLRASSVPALQQISRRVRKRARSILEHEPSLVKADRFLVSALARTQMTIAQLTADIWERGTFNEEGEPRKAIDQLRQWTALEMSLCAELGLSPASRVRIGKDAAQGTRDLGLAEKYYGIFRWRTIPPLNERAKTPGIRGLRGDGGGSGGLSCTARPSCAAIFPRLNSGQTPKRKQFVLEILSYASNHPASLP